MALAKSRRLSVAALALLLLLVAVGSLEAFPSQTYAFSSPPMVRFIVSLNSTAIAPGQTLGVTLTDVNLLPFPNEPSGYLSMPDNLTTSPCGLSYPFGMNAYQGRYTQANISSAKPLAVFDDFGIFDCPLNIVGIYRLGPFQSVTRQVDISGYWTNGTTPQPGGGISEGVLRSFAPGTCSLLVGDAWGHTALLYFQVA